MSVATKAAGSRRDKRTAAGTEQPGANAVTISGTTITNAHKVLWPAESSHRAITKADLAKYYEAVAPRMLPHIEGRPLSIVRAPDGIDGERFFQRHAPPGTSERVRFISVRGERKPFLAVDSVEGLVALAQAAVLEIHVWGSKPGDPDTPERLVFDLDPAPDVAFQVVMDVAKRVGARLKNCGFTPFLKTTGGKGLHVVAAIKGTSRNPVTWAQAREFAQAFCALMVREEPERYTINMSKQKRAGKIFLDYLRNDRMASAVAPWSPRARPGAPIALPIEWSRLRTRFDPSKFTITTVGPPLRRPDAWKALASSAAPLHNAREALRL